MRFSCGISACLTAAAAVPAVGAGVDFLSVPGGALNGLVTSETLSVVFNNGSLPEVDLETRALTTGIVQDVEGFAVDVAFSQEINEFQFRLLAGGDIPLSDRVVFRAPELLVDGELFAPNDAATFVGGPPPRDLGAPLVFELTQPHAFVFTTDGGGGGPFFSTESALRVLGENGARDTLFRAGNSGGTTSGLILSVGDLSEGFFGGGVPDDSALAALAQGDARVDAVELRGGEFVASGVLSPGIYAIELDGRGGGDLQDSSGRSAVSARFAATALPVAVPTPTAAVLAFGLAPLGCLGRRRRGEAGRWA